MSFVVYDLTFLILFTLFVVAFLYLRKDKIKREGLLILYRTSLGIKFINLFSEKYKKYLHIAEWFVIGIGYLLMLGAIFSFGQFIWIFISNPEFVRAIKIPPVAPLIPYLPQLFKADYLPFFYFTYWIIVLAITAVVHEFCHGIFARSRDIKIKSTGFAFIGPFFGAFVEPDEKKVNKLKKRYQVAFLSAGSFSNLVIAIISLFIFWLYFFAAYTESGVLFKDYSQSALNSSSITVTNETILPAGLNLTKIISNNQSYYIGTKNIPEISKYSMIIAYDDTPALRSGLIGAIVEADGNKIRDNEDLLRILVTKKPEDNIRLKTIAGDEEKIYDIKLSENPINATRGYLGIAQVNTAAISKSSSLVGKIRNKILFFKDPNTYYKPKVAEDFTIFIYNLIWWLILVNFGVALFNMLPLGITDGGRVFYLTLLGITKSEKIATYGTKLMTYLFLFAFLLITLVWIRNL